MSWLSSSGWSHVNAEGDGAPPFSLTTGQPQVFLPSVRPPTSPIDLAGGAGSTDSSDVCHTGHVAQQAQHLLPHWGRQQEVHDGIQAAVEGREQQSHLVGLVSHTPPITGRVCDLSSYVEHPDHVIRDKTEREEEEDEEGLPGGSGVVGGVGQVWFVMWRPEQRAGDLPVGHDQRDEDQPEDHQETDVDVGFPLCIQELPVVETSGNTKHPICSDHTHISRVTRWRRRFDSRSHLPVVKHWLWVSLWNQKHWSQSEGHDPDDRTQDAAPPGGQQSARRRGSAVDLQVAVHADQPQQRDTDVHVHVEEVPHNLTHGGMQLPDVALAVIQNPEG